MSLNLTSFTPSTTADANVVSSNFSAIQTLINAIRPTLYIPVDGTLVATTNIRKNIRIAQGMTLASVNIRVGTAPVGNDIKLDINKNGASVFSVRPQIDDGATTGGTTAVFGNSALSTGDILSFDIDQVGSTTPGADLVISLVMKY